MINLNPKNKLRKPMRDYIYVDINISSFQSTLSVSYSSILSQIFARMRQCEQMKKCLIDSVESKYSDD